MDTENYIKEANCQLSDKNNYKTLQTDLTLQHDKTVNDAIDQFKTKIYSPIKLQKDWK